MPSQCSMASTVVAFSVAPLSPVHDRACWHSMDARGEGCAPGKVRCMVGSVDVMHLEADDLAAVEVEDQMQINRKRCSATLGVSALQDGWSGCQFHGICQRRLNIPQKWRLEIPHFVALGVRS